MTLPSALLPAVLLLLAGGAAVVLAIRGARMLAEERRIGRRVAALAARRAVPDPSGLRRAGPGALVVRTAGRSAADRLLAACLDRSGRLRAPLLAAGLPPSLSRLLLLSIGAALLLALLAHGAGLSGPLLLLLFLGALAGLPMLALGVLARRRRARVEALLPDALGLMVRGLRAGLPAAETVAEVARELDEPVYGIFRRAYDEARLGRPLEEALREEGGGLFLPDFDFLVVTLAVQRETGGNLAETLARLADIVRRRRQLRLKTRALSSEARASAVIIGALPIAMAALMAAIAPDYFAPMVETSAGRLILGAAAALLALGAAVMAALVRLEG